MSFHATRLAVRRRGILERSEPGLAPPGVDGTRAEPAAVASVALADNVVEDVAVGRELDEFPSPLVDEPFDPRLHAGRPAAVHLHLAVEPQTPVLAMLVQRRADLTPGADLDELPRPKLARTRR